MKTDKILIAAAAFIGGISQAQQTAYFSDRTRYRLGLAENLYETKVFSAAQNEYAAQYFYNSRLSEAQREAARFFDNVIGVILQQNHAEQGLDAFIKTYPNSAYFAKANMPLADYYLAKKEFSKALEILEKVNQYQLSRDENTQYILKLGYAKYMTGDTTGATEALEESYKNLQEPANADVAYMLGHLYYVGGQAEKAFYYFDTIKNNEKFASRVRPYYLQLYFSQKNYRQAISEGTELLSRDVSDGYKAEMHKIVGESYFMTQDYAEAYPHLKFYLDAQPQPAESDLYEMGFVAAKLARYDEAVSYYSQLLNSRSPLAQNAYYQLGNAYLQTGKKQEALAAFRSAYQMDYDPKLQQLAHAQYAKIGYETGNPFESAPAVIQDFIKKYPRSEKTAEMNRLLVKSYLYSGNYRETLAAIDKLPNSTPETDKTDQEVSFLLGTEEFNKGNFQEAEKYLQRSLEFNINKETNARAKYWLAQATYQRGDYAAALALYNDISSADFPEKQQLAYDMAYAYFKQKNFPQAQKYFTEYLKNPAAEFKADAELRLADTYYAENKLNEAISIYDKADAAADYTLFQKAMALGFKGDTEAKIANMKSLLSKFPDSEYVDDAQYEIATAYAAQDDFRRSNEYFSKVINSGTDKGLVADAQIYRAQNFADLGDSAKALAELKTLGNQYKNTAYAQKIVAAAKPIFIKNNDISGYESFARSSGVNIDSAEIDEINLNTANGYFTQKNYLKAIPLYEKYLTQNPVGSALFQAKYQLGESYFRTGNPVKALLVFQEVASQQNDYQEDAQTRLAQIYISQNKPAEAKPYLEAVSGSENLAVRSYAEAALMQIYADEKDLSKAEKYADLVLINSKNSASVVESAKAIKARVLLAKGRDKDAQAAYATLEKSGNTAVAAEALFARAYFQNKGKAYKSSNETIFKLANNYAAEQYLGAKALIIMAKNYIGLKDKYQASYTVDQVLANYSEFPDVISEARELKNQIK